MQLTTFSVLTALAATVSAHGYVDRVTAGGVAYTGYLPYQDPYTTPKPDRVIREVQGNGPITDVSIADIQCGGWTAGGIVGSKPAKLYVGPVAAGSSVSLRWTLWPDSHKGPLITYLAKCPNNDCTNWLPGTAAVWFKVHHAGRVGTSNVWASSPLEVEATRGSYSYTIPSCLQAGSYIARHEVLGLHEGWREGGTQFYPSCHQIKITGSGTSTGPASKVAFPGAYKPTDPGILYDMYKAQTYTIPGPPVFTC